MSWCCWCQYPHGPNHVCQSCQCTPKCQPPTPSPPRQVPSPTLSQLTQALRDDLQDDLWPGDKECTGWGQSPNTPSPPGSPLASPTSEVNWNVDTVEIISTGRFLLLPGGNVLWATCANVLEHGTLNLPAPKPLTTTFGKKILESMELSSKSACDLLADLVQKTGISCGITQFDGISCLFLPIFEYVVTTHSSESAKITWNQLKLTASASSTGVQLIQGNPTEPLSKQGQVITLKILDHDFGTATVVKETLSLMNFEVLLISLTCSNGRIGTRVLLKTKEVRSRTKALRFGLPAICLQNLGGQNWTETPWLLSFDDV